MVNDYARRKKENIPLQRLILIVVFVCCIVKIWRTKQSGDALWIDTLCSFLYAREFIYKLVTSIFFFVNVLFLTLYLRRFTLIGSRNYFASFLYMLFCFVFPENMTLWAMTVGAFFILGMFPLLFGINEVNGASRTFMYGLFCGLLSLIYFPFLLLLLFIYVILIRESLYRLRLFILPVAGMILVYIYVYSGFYLSDSMDRIHDFHTMIQAQSRIVPVSLSLFGDGIIVFLFFFGVTASLGLIAFFKLLQKSGSEVIHKRQKYYTLLIFILLQFIFTLFFSVPYFLLAQVLLILFSILLCLSMLYVKKKVIYMIVFAILFVISFCRHFL